MDENDIKAIQLARIANEMLDRYVAICNYSSSGYIDMQEATRMILTLRKDDMIVSVVTRMRERLSGENTSLITYNPAQLAQELQLQYRAI